MANLVGRLKDRLKLLRHSPLHPQWLIPAEKSTAEWVGRSVSGLVLDIGCADRWIEAYLPAHCTYVPLDYPAVGGAIYRSRPQVFANASSLPFADACFDSVLFLEVAEHLREPGRALQEIARVLRPRGKVLMSIPFLYPIHDAPHDFQRLTMHGLQREFAAARLEILSIEESMGSAESAGLLACLAISGMVVEAWTRRHPSLVLIPLLLLAIPVVNLIAWITGKLLPAWPALTAGYLIVAEAAAGESA